MTSKQKSKPSLDKLLKQVQDMEEHEYEYDDDSRMSEISFLAKGARRITIDQFYRSVFETNQERLVTKSRSYIRSCQVWLAGCLRAVLPETDTHETTMRELAGQIAQRLDRPDLTAEERSLWQEVCLFLTWQMQGDYSSPKSRAAALKARETFLQTRLPRMYQRVKAFRERGEMTAEEADTRPSLEEFLGEQDPALNFFMHGAFMWSTEYCCRIWIAARQPGLTSNPCEFRGFTRRMAELAGDNLSYGWSMTQFARELTRRALEKRTDIGRGSGPENTEGMEACCEWIRLMADRS